MNRIPCNAILKALHKRLKGQTIAPVYDIVPANANYPLVTLGAMSAKGNGAKLLDKMQVTAQVHIWTTYRGKAQANTIANQLINLLNEKELDLSDDGFNVFDQWVDFYECYPEGDDGYNAVITIIFEIQNLE